MKKQKILENAMEKLRKKNNYKVLSYLRKIFSNAYNTTETSPIRRLVWVWQHMDFCQLTNTSANVGAIGAKSALIKNPAPYSFMTN